MLNIRKILLPVDFPNTSLGVVHQAATLAHHFRSEIVMFHVVTAQSHAPGEKGNLVEHTLALIPTGRGSYGSNFAAGRATCLRRE